MRTDHNGQIEVAGRQFVIAGFALPGQAQLVSRQHAGRHPDFKADTGRLAPAAGTIRANPFAEKTAPATIRTGNQDAFGVVDPPAAMTGLTKTRPGHPMFARTVAGRT